MKKIVFFSELPFSGKIPRNHRNSRTEYAWMIALDADHLNLTEALTHSQITTKYDLGIIIIPKKGEVFDINFLRRYCKELSVMQEGPSTYFQDYPVSKQLWYYNILQEVDRVFVHNKSDKEYIEGLTGRDKVSPIPSLIIEDTIGGIKEGGRANIIIGGNLTSWYGGFDSLVVASEVGLPVFAPSMGRRQPGEEELGINHLPYMEWTDWMYKLNEFKYAIHLMRTHAAGTFALNCAYLGIPCIGYEGLDTQEDLHTLTTVKVGDLKEAKKLIRALVEMPQFYLECVKHMKRIFKGKYSESVFKQNFFSNI